MASLKPCPTCGKDVATDARQCPHCGSNFVQQNVMKETKIIWFVFVPIAILFLLIALAIK